MILSFKDDDILIYKGVLVRGGFQAQDHDFFKISVILFLIPITLFIGRNFRSPLNFSRALCMIKVGAFFDHDFFISLGLFFLFRRPLFKIKINF